MCSTFFKAFYEELMENEFKLINGFFDKTNIDDKSKYIGVCKHIGTMFYVVMITNADNCNYFDTEQMYVESLQKMYNNIDVKNIIFLNVLISKKIDDDLLDFSEINEINYDQNVITTRWLIETESKKRVVAGKQINKLIGIEKLIDNALKNDVYTESQDIFDLIKKSKEKDLLRIKSQNYYFTYFIAIINFLVFAIASIRGLNDKLIILSGAQNHAIVNLHQYYRLFTSIFVHVNIMHLLANTLSLYIFGTRVERFFGKKAFAFIYIVSGFCSSIASILVLENSYSVGASGAIFGLMGALLVYTAKLKKSIDGFNLYFIILFCSVAIITGFMIPNVDNAGHIGGFVSGILTTFLFWRCFND